MNVTGLPAVGDEDTVKLAVRGGTVTVTMTETLCDRLPLVPVTVML